MSVKDELIIELPKEIVENSCGLSLDFGGSAVKFVYKHKDDWEEFLRQKQDTKTAKVRMGIFPLAKLEEGLQFLKCNLHKTTLENQWIYGVGFGCNKDADLIYKILNMKVVILHEIGLINKGIFLLTTNLPREEFEFMPSEKERAELLEVMRSSVHIEVAFSSFCGTWGTLVESLDLGSAMDYNETGNVPFATAVEDMYPFMIFYSHSGSAYGLVYGRDEYGIISPINTGGTAFLGLGSLLCGNVKTYDELIDMAEKGDQTKVDRTMESLAGATGAKNQNIYAEICGKISASDETLYAFAQAAASPSENFKKEDIIKSLLRMIIREQIGQMIAQILFRGVRHVIVVGSFCRRHLVRKIMLQEFYRQKVSYSGNRDSYVLGAQLHFPKAAAYLCGIGAFITDKGSSAPTEDK